MTVEEDLKPEDAADRPENRAEDASRAEIPSETGQAAGADGESGQGKDGGGDAESNGPSAVSPTQMGAARFVYAAYFAGAIVIAFLMSKLLEFGWVRLQNYRPSVGEPRDEIIMPLSALVGGAGAVYYWYRTRTRELAEQVAAEMSKVTWPSRAEVTNGTVVVIVTTIVSTVFFALMDKFWGFVTNLVYGGT
jgi:preprotein translocase subunit SecE